MTDLREATDQELAAEVEARLEAGRMGYHGLYSTTQIDYRATWTDLMDQLHDLCTADFPQFQPFRQRMIDTITRHRGSPGHVRTVAAINTTLYGREAETKGPQE